MGRESTVTYSTLKRLRTTPLSDRSAHRSAKERSSERSLM